MEVILLERIERLGVMGQTVKVRPGYARNFLLPNKKALRATKANLELFEHQRAELEARNAAERAAAEVLAAKMGKLTLVIIRQASEMGQLFGSVTARDVVDAALEAGHQLTRLQVQIDMPIKALGLFPVKIKLHPEVTTTITVNVARSPEEARVQAEKGAAVKKAAAEKAEVEAAFGAPTEGTSGVEFSLVTEEPAAEAKKPAKKAKKADAAEGEEKEAPKAKKPVKRSKKADAE
ncbi:MAG: 50S ribosomal protein L9 [Alphaproteobacteria bacterium]|nr:50S ribosomal protein L9 [Alphaproteobacteria bacterium]